MPLWGEGASIYFTSKLFVLDTVVVTYQNCLLSMETFISCHMFLVHFFVTLTVTKVRFVCFVPVLGSLVSILVLQ